MNYRLINGKTLLSFLTVCVCLCSYQATCWAHGAGGDIALFSSGDQADVGFAILDDDDDLQEFFDPDESVFNLVLLPLGENNPIAPWEFGSSEPGFDADEGTLPPEADIHYNLLDLWYFDGDASQGIQLEPAAGIVGGVSPSPQKSFASGGFHSHPYFGVAAPNGTVAPGVYVGKMSVSVEGLRDSDPYYMIGLVTEEVNQLVSATEQTAKAEEIGEMARLFADDPVANPAPVIDGVDFRFFSEVINHVRAVTVPEPGSALLSFFCLAGLCSRCRSGVGR